MRGANGNFLESRTPRSHGVLRVESQEIAITLATCYFTGGARPVCASGVHRERRGREEGDSAIWPGILGLASSGNEGKTNERREVWKDTAGGVRSELARSNWGGEVLLLPSFSDGCGITLQQDRMHLAWP